MRSKPVILVALLLPAFLVNLDTTVVNVALPALVRELHATTTQASAFLRGLTIGALAAAAGALLVALFLPAQPASPAGDAAQTARRAARGRRTGALRRICPRASRSVAAAVD